MKNDFKDFAQLEAMKNDPVSERIDGVFKSIIKVEILKPTESLSMSEESNPEIDEFSLDMMDESELTVSDQETPPDTTPLDEGIELAEINEESLQLGEADSSINLHDTFGDLESLEADEEFSLDQFQAEADDQVMENLGELSFDQPLDIDDPLEEIPKDSTATGLKLSEDASTFDLNLGYDSFSLDPHEDLPEGLDSQNAESESDADLSDEAMEKLKEIDAIMEHDASEIYIKNELNSIGVEEELVAEDPVEEEIVPEIKEEIRIQRKRSVPVNPEIQSSRNLGHDLQEISGAYSGEMERMQATISNLRSDREELLARIQKSEEEKMLQGRQSLTMRAELDEKKIELTIIRKKLNEEINELKDRLKLHDEKKLIWEEKVRILTQELDKTSQKNKIDVKKVQMRERELEQKLELLKSDAESQIRHRDLKILELKRKIDSMEFDMESISSQEKKSVESRFELEDKLDKAIKTLRNAITVLEDDTEHSSTLNTLKKNLNM